MPSRRALFAWIPAATIAVAAGCGGDGSLDTATSLSGLITVPETAAVDGDTNDPRQANRRANDTFATAQPLRWPVLLAGSVNQPGTGAPEGANRTAGDVLDIYELDLQPGQVIELEFTADPTTNDLDLYAYADGAAAGDPAIGESSGDGNHECLRIDRAARYRVAVAAAAGASLYNLRVGSPGDGITCQNVVSAAAGLVPGQVVARPGAAAQDGERVKALRAGGLSGARAADGVPVVLRLPADRGERAAAVGRLAALATSGGTGDDALVTAAASLPPALRDVLETVMAAKHLRRGGLYQWAEPNYVVKTASEPVGTYPPADRLYPYQRWHYEMIGLPAAMSLLVPRRDTLVTRPVVAVIDSGIVADHPDFAGQIGEQASFTESGVFGPSADDPGSQASPTAFHGTHVAGTVAAATFDETGVAGVAPMVSLLPIRVFAKDAAVSSTADVAQAILYAAGLPNGSGTVPVRRADVINLSLGSARSCPAAYVDAISRARAAGVVVVAASGNEGLAVRNSPSNCPGVWSVGAVDAQRRHPAYANTDPDLSLAAPGGDSQQSTTGNGLPDEVYSTLGDFQGGLRVPSYGGLAGTSMAAPHVSGVVALMRYAHPGLTVEQLDGLLLAGRLTDDVEAAGRDAASGIGLINAAKAVGEALALAGGTGEPVVGQFVVQPSALDFGASRTTADLQFSVQGGSSAEAVVSVTTSLPAITVTPTAVDARGLGNYTVAVARDALAAGSHFARITITTTARVVEVGVTVLKAAPGAGPAVDYGRVYVLAIDADTSEPVAQVGVDVAGGTYTWQLDGIRARRVQVIAGTDLDGDGLLCQSGEPCGGYPRPGAGLSVLELTGSRTGLDFEVSPRGGSGGDVTPRRLLAP